MKENKRGKEDYLRAIYGLYEGKTGVKSADIARELNVSKPSVSEMMRKLADSGYVNIKKYSKVELTRKGKIHAEKHYNNHSTIKRFVKKLLNFGDEKAHEEAHKLEHAFSPEALEIIKDILNEKDIHTEAKGLPSYIG